MERVNPAAGKVLRDVRRAQNLTLREVAARSGGRFKPTVLAGYERGERSMSLARFVALAEFYGIRPDRLLTRVLQAMEPEDPVVVVDLATAEEIEPVEVIRLRAGDLEAVAKASGVDLERLLAAFQPIMRRDRAR